MNVPDLEKKIGIEVYATKSKPCPAKIREMLEDFIVVEIIDPSYISKEKEENSIELYLVNKKGKDIFSFSEFMTKKIRSRIRFLGLKDKRSVSFQYCVSPEKLNLRLIGFVKKENISSLLVGNAFRIVLRDHCSSIHKAFEEVNRAVQEKTIPNFFGIQRFGIERQNHLVGKMILKGMYREAVEFLSQGGGRYERELKKAVSSGADYKRALRKIPIAIRRIFVQSYQSYIFNLTMSRAVKQGIEINRCAYGDYWFETDKTGLKITTIHGPNEPPQKGSGLLVQLVGYAYKDTGSRFDKIIREILTEEQVKPRDFYIKEMQELSCHGSLRRASIYSYKTFMLEEDYTVLKFILPKGQYATVLLRELIKPSDEELKMFV